MDIKCKYSVILYASKYAQLNGDICIFKNDLILWKSKMVAENLIKNINYGHKYANKVSFCIDELPKRETQSNGGIYILKNTLILWKSQKIY